MTNNKPQTAVEWLETQILDLIPNDIGSQLKFKNKIKQAKECEREQIVNAVDGFPLPNRGLNGDDYYNKTYGGNDQ